MSRAFTDQEAQQIRIRLLEAAAEAFARHGVRRVSIDELTAAAGISKGAFYRFFPSKDSLLVALLHRHEEAAHADIEAAVAAHPEQGIDALVDRALQAGRDPLVAAMTSDDGLRVLRSLPAGEVEVLLDRDSRLVERLVERLDTAGFHFDIEPPVLLGLLRSLVFTGRHRDEIGAELVEATSGWLKGQLRSCLRPTDPERGQ